MSDRRAWEAVNLCQSSVNDGLSWKWCSCWSTGLLSVTTAVTLALVFFFLVYYFFFFFNDASREGGALSTAERWSEDWRGTCPLCVLVWLLSSISFSVQPGFFLLVHIHLFSEFMYSTKPNLNPAFRSITPITGPTKVHNHHQWKILTQWKQRAVVPSIFQFIFNLTNSYCRNEEFAFIRITMIKQNMFR